MNLNRQITLSLSLKAYKEKPAKIWDITYLKQTITIQDLIDKISDGHSITYCYDDNDEIFDQHTKTKNNFRYTWLIGVDVDHETVDMNTYINSLEFKPTLAYETFSNNADEKNYRYRLLYIFDEKIKGEETYINVYKWLTHNLHLKDNCMASCNQQMHGTNKSAKWYISDNFYNIPSECIAQTTISPSTKSVKSKYPNIPNTNNIEKRVVHISCDDTCGHLLSDLNKMTPFDFLMKYRDKYPYFCASPLHYENGYATIDENYFEIRRKWHKDVYETPNGEKTIISVAKLHDGNMRRIRLRTVAKIIRNIMPDITFEHLLYILVYERTYYYDNSDKTLTNRKLISIAKQVIEAPFETIKMIGDDKRKFKVDKAYWREQGITPRQAVQIIRKGKKYEEIGSMYDFNLTDTENIKVMKDNGLSISINTLKRWRKENNIDKKEKQMKQDVIKDYYNSQLTDEQNIKLMNENGVKVSINTLRRWRKQNGITREIGGDHCSQSYKDSQKQLPIMEASDQKQVTILEQVPKATTQNQSITSKSSGQNQSITSKSKYQNQVFKQNEYLKSSVQNQVVKIKCSSDENQVVKDEKQSDTFTFCLEELEEKENIDLNKIPSSINDEKTLQLYANAYLKEMSSAKAWPAYTRNRDKYNKVMKNASSSIKSDVIDIIKGKYKTIETDRIEWIGIHVASILPYDSAYDELYNHGYLPKNSNMYWQQYFKKNNAVCEAV